MKRGLVLNRVVLLGRTFEEYCRYFALSPKRLRGKRVLDVAGGVSSFCAEANELGIETTAFDMIYDMPGEEIERRCGPDLEEVIRSIEGLTVYRWEFYKNPEFLRTFRERAYRMFLNDYAKMGGRRYVPGRLPEVPFGEAQFDLTLVSYLLFVYEDQLSYEFHAETILNLMRITRGELRLYPLVTFEGRRSSYIDRLRADPRLHHLTFAEVPTDFEFLIDSNSFLRVTRS
jgi:hypothetical protein